MAETPVALITGSTRGIGWATARTLAADGYTVVLNGRDQDAVASRVDELRRSSDAAVAGQPFDVADSKAVAECIAWIRKELGALDVLVANAGVKYEALLGMIREHDLHRTMAVNVEGTVNLVQAAARLMMRAQRGSIVLLSSVMGIRGNAGQVAYAASKAAIVGITLSAARELGPRGIRVNAVAPGIIDTDLIADTPPEALEQWRASTWLGRLGTPEDVAEAVRWLASDRAGFVTGQVLGVDGGLTH
jgi:3-oxoacyl-[acyl-carrier protein] reductase